MSVMMLLNRRRGALVARGMLAAMVLFALGCATSPEPFRIIVWPDSQNATEKWPELIKPMSEWIVANRDKENIKYVLHVGDMVQTGDNEQEWQRFDAGTRPLEGQVPYVFAPGNHDFDKRKPGRSTVLFNKYFPLERAQKQPGFGGSFPAGSNTNSYHTFKAGGMKWLKL